MATLVISPEKNPKPIELTSEDLVFGSGEEALIRVQGLKPRHAVISQRGSRHYLEAVKGAPGVLLNGKAIEFEPLTDGDRIEIGGHVMAFNPPLPDDHGEDPDEATMLEGVAPDEATPVTGAGSLPARVIVSQGEEVVGAYPIDKPNLLVGRSSRNDIPLDHPQVSGRHARIVQESETIFRVQDLQSSNGTVLHGSKIDDERLYHQDRVTIGPFVLMLDAPGAGTSPLEEADTGDHDDEATIAPAADGGGPDHLAKLIGIGEANHGREYPVLEALTILGRTGGIALDDASISREHARLQFEAGQFTLVDLESANGVHVNGEKRDKASLNHGDHVRLGNVDLFFAIGGNVYMLPKPGEAIAPKNDTPPNRLRPALFAAVAVMFVAAVYVNLPKSEPSPAPTPAPAKSSQRVSPLLLKSEIQEAIEIQDWEGCLAGATRYQEELGNDPEIDHFIEMCRKESENQSTLIRGNRLREGGQFDDAMAAYGEILNSAAYGKTAESAIEETKGQAASYYASEAAKLLEADNCAEAITFYGYALLYDEGNEDLVARKLEAERACAPPTARPVTGPTGPSQRALAQRDIDAAHAAYKAGDFAQAIEKAEAALSRSVASNNPSREEAARLVPLLKSVKRSLDKAESSSGEAAMEAYRQAILTDRRVKVGPSVAEQRHLAEVVAHYVQKGQAAMGAGNSPEAYRAWSRAVGLDPSNPTAKDGLKEIDEKVSGLMVQVKINRKNTKLQNELILQIFDLLPPESRDYKEAKAIYDENEKFNR